MVRKFPAAATRLGAAQGNYEVRQRPASSQIQSTEAAPANSQVRQRPASSQLRRKTNDGEKFAGCRSCDSGENPTSMHLRLAREAASKDNAPIILPIFNECGVEFAYTFAAQHFGASPAEIILPLFWTFDLAEHCHHWIMAAIKWFRSDAGKAWNIEGVIELPHLEGNVPKIPVRLVRTRDERLQEHYAPRMFDLDPNVKFVQILLSDKNGRFPEDKRFDYPGQPVFEPYFLKLEGSKELKAPSTSVDVARAFASDCTEHIVTVFGEGGSERGIAYTFAAQFFGLLPAEIVYTVAADDDMHSTQNWMRVAAEILKSDVGRAWDMKNSLDVIAVPCEGMQLPIRLVQTWDPRLRSSWAPKLYDLNPNTKFIHVLLSDKAGFFPGDVGYDFPEQKLLDVETRPVLKRPARVTKNCCWM